MAKIIFIYIILGAIVLGMLKRKTKKMSFAGGYAGFTFGMLIYYVIVPILIIINETNFRNGIGFGYDRIINYIYEAEYYNFLFLIVLVGIGFIGFNCGYKTLFLKNLKKDTESKIKTISNEYNNEKLMKIINNVAFFALAIGGVSLILFFLFVGGVGKALMLAQTTRGFEHSVTDINYFAGIAKLFARMMPISAIMFFYLFLTRNKKSDKILLVITFIMSILLYLTYAGRTPLLTFLLIFLFFLMRLFFKKVWFKIIFLGVLSIPLLDMLSQVFIYFQSGVWISSESNYLDYLRQFAPPTFVGLNLQDIVDVYGFRFYKDVVTDVIGLLPGISFQYSYENTSQYFNGIYWRNYGGIPNDVISYGYIQFGILGVFITLFSWGMIMGILDRIIYTIPNQIGGTVIATILATHVYQIVFAADLAPILLTHNIFIMTTIILLIYNQVKKINNQGKLL